MNVTLTDRQAIRSAIEHQLVAFQRDQADIAFGYASPAIQAKFGTPTNFLHMVRLAYPVVYRPRSVLFGNLILVEDAPAQIVFLLDADGTLVKAIYLMEKQADATWKINGCFLEVNQDSDRIA